MIIWLKGAQKDLQKLPRGIMQKVLDAMDLYHDERVGDVKKLTRTICGVLSAKSGRVEGYLSI